MADEELGETRSAERVRKVIEGDDGLVLRPAVSPMTADEAPDLAWLIIALKKARDLDGEGLLAAARDISSKLRAAAGGVEAQPTSESDFENCPQPGYCRDRFRQIDTYRAQHAHDKLKIAGMERTISRLASVRVDLESVIANDRTAVKEGSEGTRMWTPAEIARDAIKTIDRALATPEDGETEVARNDA